MDADGLNTVASAAAAATAASVATAAPVATAASHSPAQLNSTQSSAAQLCPPQAPPSTVPVSTPSPAAPSPAPMYSPSDIFVTPPPPALSGARPPFQSSAPASQLPGVPGPSQGLSQEEAETQVPNAESLPDLGVILHTFKPTITFVPPPVASEWSRVIGNLTD